MVSNNAARHTLPAGHAVRSRAILNGLHHEYWLEKVAKHTVAHICYMRPRSFLSANEMAPQNRRAEIAPAGPDSSRKITVSISMPAL